MLIPCGLRAGKEAPLGRLAALLLVLAAPGPVARLARLQHAAHAFSPRMDFEQWRPLTGRGDPLRNDPTYDYEPPVLERVHYWAQAHAHRPRPDAKSEVLVLGISSRRPSAGPPPPPPPPPPPSRRFPDTLLQPPPPPPPAPAAPTRPTEPTYALQEADLVYHSSTLDAVSGDYAGWGPTTPLDADDDAHNLIPGGILHVRGPSYALYAPMPIETSTAGRAAAETAPTTAPKTAPTIALTTIPTTAPTAAPTTATDETTEERTDPARPTDVAVTEAQRYERTTRSPARPVAAPQPQPLHMIGPMMTMPLSRPDDVSRESPPARRDAQRARPPLDSPFSYLIIQGHSKVKTYGSRPPEPAPARHRNAIEDYAPKSAESLQVKHLHARAHRASERAPAPARLGAAKSLRAIVASGVGGSDWREAELGVEYDVSDGSGVPLEAYRRGIVESDLRRRPAARPTPGPAR